MLLFCRTRVGVGLQRKLPHDGVLRVLDFDTKLPAVTRADSYAVRFVAVGVYFVRVLEDIAAGESLRRKTAVLVGVRQYGLRPTVFVGSHGDGQQALLFVIAVEVDFAVGVVDDDEMVAIVEAVLNGPAAAVGDLGNVFLRAVGEADPLLAGEVSRVRRRCASR
jgi:hypothetical protein